MGPNKPQSNSFFNSLSGTEPVRYFLKNLNTLTIYGLPDAFVSKASTGYGSNED